MKSLARTAGLAALTTTLALFPSLAMAQPVAQTPLAQPVQVSGSVIPSRSSNCGFLAEEAAQVLQVNEEFASVDITVSGDSGVTLLVEGSNGFMECLTTNALAGNTTSSPGLLNQGTYSFYVGNENQTPTAYNLVISQN
ncbi:MAG: hypothetical protein HC922_02120 [Leptolyngbyaceae cyanobacterium SM2_3_12]|nr:hypothetical protein [Leptolyngbyaceae cyanobacterium SM2_3_12]